MTSLLARGTRRDPSSPPDPISEQVRALLGVALRPTSVAIVLISAAVLVTLVSSNSALAGAVGAVAAGWLALHQVSLTVTDAPLGILPLLPTALLVWAVARGCARAVTPESSLRDAARVVAAAVAGPVAATLISLAVITDAAVVIPLEPPSALEALACVIGIHLVAACAGVVAVIGRAECARLGAPEWLPAGVRPAARAAGLLFAAGAAVSVASLVWSWSEVGGLLDDGHGFVGLLGLTVLSVLYLPNVAVGAVAVLVGGTAQAGGTTLSLFEIVGGPVPPVPVLGGVPTTLVGSAWPVLLAVPVTVGALLGRDCGRLRLSVQETVYTVACAAAGVGVLAALVGFLAGGDIGSYGFVGVEPVVLGLVTFGWLAVPGAVVGALIARRGDAGTGDDEAESEDADGTPPETSPSAPDFEVKRLERPTLRYRSAPVPELEQPAVEQDGAEQSAPQPTTEDAPTETIVEAEIVSEPADPSVVNEPSGADTASTADEIEADVEEVEAEPEKSESEGTEAAEGDLPDGPVTPRD
ncbi:cell division protein PerM [Rhodococcus sp. ACT016]|uniref:cell division protein PerM n=1 Tax=Rhodococcus sp. ACT016 TaxID=3134808 RepID=UPI003D2E105D